MAGWLYEVIEVTGSVHYSMYFNLLAADDVEDEVRFNDQDPITIFSKFRMPWYSPQRWMLLKQTNSFANLSTNDNARLGLS